jgi:hypothetical protein
MLKQDKQWQEALQMPKRAFGNPQRTDSVTPLVSVSPVTALILITALLACTIPALAQSTLHFAQVEILLTDQFTLDYLTALPRAPGSDVEVIDNPPRVIVQIPADLVQNLIEQGADVVVLERFLMAEGSAEDLAQGGSDGLTGCSGDYRFGEKVFDVTIPDTNTWTYNAIEISGAPAGAGVRCIKIEYQIVHTYEMNLIVELTDEGFTHTHRLWDHQGGSLGYIFEVENGITTFNGEVVNQIWWLRVKNDLRFGHGYIDHWRIWVYYGHPPHDLCQDAIRLTEDNPYADTTDSATGTDKTSCGFNDRWDVWHSYIPQTTHPVKISLAGSTFDTTLAVFAACGGKQLACNDDVDDDVRHSEIVMNMIAAQMYLIRIAGHDAKTGDYVITVTNPCLLLADFDLNCDVDLKDLVRILNHWLDYEPSINLAPPTGIIDFADYSKLTDHWGTYEPSQITNDNPEPSIPIVLKRCRVRAGKTDQTDSINTSGTCGVTEHDLLTADQLEVTITSAGMPQPYVVTFPIEHEKIRRGRYRSPRTRTTGRYAPRTSFKLDTNRGTFSLNARNIDLTGLSCPLHLNLEVGDYFDLAQATEDKVNGRRPIPIELMKDFADAFRVDRIRARSGRRPSTDSLSVKGAIALADSSVNLQTEQVALTLDTQTFTILPGRFQPRGNKGKKYHCRRVPLPEGGEAAVAFDFDRCTFSITIRKTTLDSTSGTVDFCIEFGDFSECVEVDLP